MNMFGLRPELGQDNSGLFLWLMDDQIVFKWWVNAPGAHACILVVYWYVVGCVFGLVCAWLVHADNANGWGGGCLQSLLGISQMMRDCGVQFAINTHTTFGVWFSTENMFQLMPGLVHCLIPGWRMWRPGWQGLVGTRILSHCSKSRPSYKQLNTVFEVCPID